MSAYSDAPNRRVVASNGVDYAYRDLGEGFTPLVLLQHFRGNLDNWDPAFIDALASRHRVVTFDNTGVGGTTGTTPSTVAQIGRDAIEFMTAMGFDQVDLLGFSIGSFVAQEVALSMGQLVVITGPPGAGKSTVAAIAAHHLNPSALIAGDAFFAFLDQGAIPPWLPESDDQNRVVGPAAVTSPEGSIRRSRRRTASPQFERGRRAASRAVGALTRWRGPEQESCARTKA